MPARITTSAKPHKKASIQLDQPGSAGDTTEIKNTPPPLVHTVGRKKQPHQASSATMPTPTRTRGHSGASAASRLPSAAASSSRVPQTPDVSTTGTAVHAVYLPAESRPASAQGHDGGGSGVGELIDLTNMDPRRMVFNIPPVPTHGAAAAGAGQDLHSVIMRQLEADWDAYHHDASFCEHQLHEAHAIGLSPQECRTLQLRLLDAGHQIRGIAHRLEVMQYEAEAAKVSAMNPPPIPIRRGRSFLMNGTKLAPAAAAYEASAIPASTVALGKRAAADSPAPSDDGVARCLPKRPRADSSSSSVAGDTITFGGAAAAAAAASLSDQNLPPSREDLTRKGEWNCRLCRSAKFALNPLKRQPAQPAKWPLRDTSKLMAHLMDLHSEHTVAERCIELGTALDRNRGPFEYWVRKTRGSDAGEGGDKIDRIINGLQKGYMPVELRPMLTRTNGKEPQIFDAMRGDD